MGEFKDHEGNLNQAKDLKGRVCCRPFQLMEIQREFYSYLCCPSWLPTIVGNVEKSSLMETWNSEIAQDVRASIHDGSFRHCDHLECPEIQAGKLPTIDEVPEHLREVFLKKQVVLDSPPGEIALCYDESCNLACPSCRTHRLSLKAGSEYERRLEFTQKLLEDLKIESQRRPVILRVTGSGDPIGSKIFRTSLMSMSAEDYPMLEISLQTNGVLFSEKVWANLEGIREKIKFFSVSIDAGTAETYNLVRKYGHWDRLWKNMEFLSGLRKDNKIKSLWCNYVVQSENYREMPRFVELCLALAKVDHIFFSFVNDWDTWDKAEYEKQCIWKVHHPEFKSFLEVLKSPLLDRPEVGLGNISYYRQLALAGASGTELER